MTSNSEVPEVLGEQFFRIVLTLNSQLTATSSVGTDLITIYVGKQQKEFVVHKKLVCETTEYFLKAFTGAFKEREGVIHLPEGSSLAFSLFIDWLYRGNVIIGNSPEYLTRLFKIHVFAEKLCLEKLANQVIDCITTMAIIYEEANTSPSILSYTLKNTFVDSPLRKWAIHDFAYTLYCEDKSHVIPGKEHLKLIRHLSQENEDFVEAYFLHIRTWDKEQPLNYRAWTDQRQRQCVFHRHKKGAQCIHQGFTPPAPWPTSGKGDALIELE